MLYLDVDKEKTLTFEVEISGLGIGDIRGSVRFIYEDIEYGFPADIKESEITAVIKPLNELFPKIKNGTIIEARLDLNTDSYYFSPWKGEIKVQAPIVVEAKLTDGDSTKKKDFGVKAKIIKDEKKIVKQKSKLIREDKNKWTKESIKNISEEQIFEFMRKAGTKNERIQKIIFENAQSKAKSADNFAVFKEVVKALKKPKS